ncbi:MAG: hypothetical protein Q7U16_04360 [Agitococcus sp.]|nr:hypothetical protein [Agitococcus sp.]
MQQKPKAGKKTLLKRTLKAANIATEVAKDLADMAQETAKAVVSVAVDVASDTAQSVVQMAGGGAKMTVQLASGTAKAATQMAQEAALQMAQTYFSKTTLTISLPESQLNKQLRQMTEGHPYLDFITVSCGSDRLTVALDGHYQRLVYTLSLDFDVLECKVSHDEQFLLLRQVDTGLDAQLRQAPTLSNFALRRAAHGVAFVAKRLPSAVTPASLLLNSVSGVSEEGPNLWRVALHKNVLMELLHNRSWMVDKLLTLADLSVIPGLSLLLDSEDMLLRLVNQFEIRSMRVLPNRLELLIGINT